MTNLSAIHDNSVPEVCAAASGRYRPVAGVLMALMVFAARADEPMQNVSIYAGSRGTGVPEATRARLLEVEQVLTDEQASAPGAFRFRRSVVGLEGETMLCIAFHDASSREAVLARLQPMVAPVSLLSMTRSNCSVD